MTRLLSCLALVMLASGSAWAQQGTAELQGRVLDQQGGMLPGVAIVVTNQETGQFRQGGGAGHLQ